ncbi:DUF1961 family protein [Pseudocolwellia agarivorans]|uniref:DUF1961 family protein n=1 Tax=Pseudocolwellia agarivorans TaxID=1911682 RepID=UPI0009879988|nr:DUF1961 family protein [Pseudocolwellia agarivorans]
MKKNITISFTCLLASLLFCAAAFSSNNIIIKNTKFDIAYKSLSTLNWQLVFEDIGTGNWQENWGLDGLKAKVDNSPNGMTISAGPKWQDDTHHATLWTKKSFNGDIKIEYNFTRLDHNNRGVNILYVQATGRDIGPYKKDIFAWSKLREVPVMRYYINNMHLYHLSYAAFRIDNNDESTDYLKSRRYMPQDTKSFPRTGFGPTFAKTGFFKPGVLHHITYIKKGTDVYFHVVNPEQSKTFYFDGSSLPSIEEGPIGLRLMYTRSSLFKNFRVSELKDQTVKQSSAQDKP